MLGMLSPESGQFCRDVRKHSVLLRFLAGANVENMETCLAGRLQRSRPNSILGRLFGEPQQKHCVFDSFVWIQGRAQTGSPLPVRTRFLAVENQVFLLVLCGFQAARQHVDY